MRTQAQEHFFIALLLASLVLSISGCGGEFNYKRGADIADFEKEKESCAGQNKAEGEIGKCLQKSGWVVVGIDKPLVSPQPETAVKMDVGTIIVDQEAIETTINPLERMHISSWWKAGAGPDRLLADGDSCASELGEGYKPEGNMSIVTIGLVRCMKDKGWFALQQK